MEYPCAVRNVRNRARRTAPSLDFRRAALSVMVEEPCEQDRAVAQGNPTALADCRELERGEVGVRREVVEEELDGFMAHGVLSVALLLGRWIGPTG